MIYTIEFVGKSELTELIKNECLKAEDKYPGFEVTDCFSFTPRIGDLVEIPEGWGHPIFEALLEHLGDKCSDFISNYFEVNSIYEVVCVVHIDKDYYNNDGKYGFRIYLKQSEFKSSFDIANHHNDIRKKKVQNDANEYFTLMSEHSAIMSIEECVEEGHLSTKTKNILLLEFGITNVRELTLSSETDLLHARGMGRKTIESIKTMLSIMGLSLRNIH